MAVWGAEAFLQLNPVNHWIQWLPTILQALYRVHQIQDRQPLTQCSHQLVHTPPFLPHFSLSVLQPVLLKHNETPLLQGPTIALRINANIFTMAFASGWDLAWPSSVLFFWLILLSPQWSSHVLQKAQSPPKSALSFLCAIHESPSEKKGRKPGVPT